MKFFIKIKTLHSPEVDDKVTAIHSSSSFRMKMQTLKGRKKITAEKNKHKCRQKMFMFINYPWRENEKKTEVAMTCWWQKELAERDVTEREDRMKWEREMVMRRREEWGKICLIHSMTNIAKVVMEDVKILWTLFIFLVFVCVLLFLLVGEAFY
jgi:broad specificity polyphosphatase/5'/3'-nucleotidase SurE